MFGTRYFKASMMVFTLGLVIGQAPLASAQRFNKELNFKFSSRTKLRNKFPNGLYQSTQWYDFSLIQPIHSLTEWKREDVARYIPPDMPSGTNGTNVASRILSPSIDSFFRSPEVQNSGAGKSAKAFENAVESDISFGQDDEDSSGTQHSIKFKMITVQSKAQVQYEGFIKSEISYQLVDSKFAFDVYEELVGDTQMVLSHTTIPGENRDIMSLRWNW